MREVQPLSPFATENADTTANSTPAAAAAIPGAQRVSLLATTRDPPLSRLSRNIRVDDTDNLLSSSDFTAMLLSWARLSSPDGPEVAENGKQQQQQTPSKTFSDLPTSVQTRSIPFVPSMDGLLSFSDSAECGTPPQFAALPLQQRSPSFISQGFLNESRTMNHYTASSFVHGLDTKASAVTDSHLGVANTSFPALPNVLSVNRADEERRNCVISYINHGEACGDEGSPTVRQAPLHESTSFFSTPLSSRPSTLLSPSTPAPEEYSTGYTSVLLPMVPPSFTGEDYYDYAMHGQVEFVKQLCDGTGGNDDDGNGGAEELRGSGNMSRSSSLQRLQLPTSLHGKAGSLGDLPAAPGSRSAMEVAPMSAPAHPASSPLSTFQPLSIATTSSGEYHTYSAASTGRAGTAWDASTGGNKSNESVHAHSQVSSGSLQTPLLPSQGMTLLQHQQSRAPFTPSPLPAQTWTSTAGAAIGEEMAAQSTSQQQYQQLQASTHSQSISRQYSTGATPGAASSVGPALSGSGVYSTSLAKSLNASTGYHTGNGTPPSGGPAHLIMLVPASSESSSTGHATQGQRHLYAMQAPAQMPSTSETASAPLYAPPRDNGAVQSTSVPLSSSATMVSDSGASAVPLLYVTAPTAFAGLPPTAARCQANASPPSSVSGHSCVVSMTQAPAPETSPPTSQCVYLQTYPSAPSSQSRPLSLQQYSGNFASQVPGAGIPTAAKHATSASFHARTSSQVPMLATTTLPHSMNTATFSQGSRAVGLSCPSIQPGAPAKSTDMLRKQVNVHGAMMNVLPFYPYNESAPPAPTAQIVTGVRSPSNSTVTQSLGGSGWSSPSVNSNTGCNLEGSCRSLEGAKSQDGAEVSSYTWRSDTPSLANAPVLPIFIQMFPCELRDRVGLLNRVIVATCGRDAGLVQSFEARSETSFIAHVRTNNVWELIYKLRCRVLMDRFGFWYAANIDQYVRMKEYCESVRRLPQQTRHFQTDGLPCMPLVVELSRSVNRSLVRENTGPRCFDELVPIAAVDRHRSRLQGSSSGHNSHANVSMGGTAVPASGTTAADASVFLTKVNDARPLHGGPPVFLTNQGHVMMVPPHLVPGLAGGKYLTDLGMSGSSTQVKHMNPQLLPLSFTLGRSS
ncbi:hypothetical protein, conserved [Leishmania tarentolae]|uniref:Uncharacterized protein n=1 Tax=Leishmania tarentolae TaxID=5689 RepID=A0A640KBW1_LEITA|nr:hypothetical protein, conserved [Leishmania tarentolae]